MRSLFPPNLVERMTRRKPLYFDDADELPQDIGADNGGGVVSPAKATLRRTLSLADLILYGVGCSVGAGIYCLVGLGAEIAGPAIALSFGLCGAACVFTALAYGEFAARIPVTGSAYVYAYVTFGEFVAWLVGWSLTLNYAFSASVVARSWGEYLAAFLRGLPYFQSRGLKMRWLTRMKLSWLPLVPKSYTCSPLSIVIVVICTAVLVTGAKESSRFNNAMTVLNLGILGFVVFAGLGSGTVEGDNLVPFFPEGFGGVLRGSGLVFFAFIGFDMVACLSEEVINPERSMPMGIVGTLAATTAIYVSVTLVVIGMAPFDLLGGDVPIVNALLANGCCTHEEQLLDAESGEQCLNQSCSPIIRPILLYGSRMVSFGAIFGLTTGTFTSLMGQPRIFYRMAMDGLLYKVFAKINPRTQVPNEGILLTGVLCSALACFVYLDALANLISLGTLAVFTFVDAGVIILRMRPLEDVAALEGTTYSTELNDVDEFSQKYDDDNVIQGGFEESLWEMILSKHRRHSTSGSVESNGNRPIILSIVFTLSAILASMAYTNSLSSLIPLACLVMAAYSAIALFLLPKSDPPDTFQCPYVPAVPLIGLACNGYMMGSLPTSTWQFMILWLLVGIVVYFAYGVRNSVLGKESEKGMRRQSASYGSLLWEGTRLLSDGSKDPGDVSLHGMNRHEHDM
jgi:APA family basic amino acid/polyamine antiporter